MEPKPEHQVQSQPTGEYQMNNMGQQHPPTSEPPNYHQQQQGMPPPQEQQYPPMQSPPVQQGMQQPGMSPYGYQQEYGMPLAALQSTTAPVLCPNCGHRGMTNVEYESGGFTHLVALAVCCLVCLGCFAYMANSLKDAHHRCSKCGVPLATYHRSGRTELHFRPQ